MASLPSSEIAYQQAHINDNHSTTLIAVSTVFCGVALLSLVVRLIARRLANAILGWDDYLAIATMVEYPWPGQDALGAVADHGIQGTSDRLEHRYVSP